MKTKTHKAAINKKSKMKTYSMAETVNIVSEPQVAFSAPSFKFTFGGKQKSYEVNSGYGYFLSSLKKAENITDVSGYLENGIKSKEIQSIIKYFDFKVPEIAKAASVSASTVTRWAPDSSIGLPGSNQFFKIDEVVRKGVRVFGGEEPFKNWLTSPNLAMGNATPAKLITSVLGVELVDEALDALAYGTVM